MELRIVEDSAQAGALVATRIADLVEHAAAAGRRVVIGCPAGRTPRSTYAALGRLAACRGLDLARLDVVMMDEYVARTDRGWLLCASDVPHSCRGYAAREIHAVLNAGVPHARRLAARCVHFPDPQDPERYETTIEALGGIDLFLLAAGSSDGHVAFNPPDTSLESRTRIVTLAESTRRDNLATFPSFGTIDHVPTHGVSVGLGTIARHARAVVLLLLGEGKRIALERTLAEPRFDPAWPASVVYACASAEIVADRAAHGRVPVRAVS